ncbi:MAG TPA: nucleotidyltransferase [Candidatus Scatovivens faecipullorum]|nr:nucleotidyltransferase [Candidatus Scatovivens faecipullorum]
MDGILGIVSEYNPFHNGHLHHLEVSKQLTKSAFTVAVMSGNFVQRGNTSLVDKWVKTEMALKNGIDLVIELPTVYAISSAENFADGAIKILNSLGVVDYVSFGSEIGEINSLNEVANILYKEPKEFSNLISAQLKSGISYPKAREIALTQYFGTSKKYSEILNNPNNILGVEYLKSIKKHRSHIKPITIKRDYSDYNSTKEKNGIASATAIRTMIQNNKNVHYVVPYETYELLDECIGSGKVIPDLKVFEKEIIYILRKMNLSEIALLPDVSEGLENKIKIAANNFNTLEELISNIKSKRYTQSRIQRILLYALLNITQKDMNSSKRVTPYIRVLGFNKHGKRIISAIAAANPRLTIIVSVKKFMENSINPSLRNMISKDIFASNVYTLGFKENPLANLDYTHKVVEI